MCGISGIWHLTGEPLQEGKLERFTDSFRERGPDGSGYDYFEDRSLGLGHRRLSILDLSEAGRQPMNFQNRYSITYNGEVFNFEELRTELVKLGDTFSTATDTEVVLAAYARWGKDCLNRFNGMWAMAIWDEQTKELFLARDRFGVKPLYFVYQPGVLFAFASETRAFKELQGFAREPDETNISLQSQGVSIHGSGHTIFKNIHQILPGHLATISKNGDFLQRRWWDIRNHNHQKVSTKLSDQSEEFYDLFRDACRLRMISDVSIGTALSGGLDSSSVYSVVFDLLKNESMHRVPQDSQRAFVATFPGLIIDERDFAEEALKFTGGPAVFLNQEYENLTEQVVSDTLKADSLSNMPITSVSGIYKGMKSAGITVSLDGHGVDEMMYGYRDMLHNLFYYYFKTGQLNKAREMQRVIVPTYHKSEQDSALNNLEKMMIQSRGLKERVKMGVKKITKSGQKNYPGYTTFEGLEKLGEPYNFSNMPYDQRMLYQETFVDTLPYLFGQFDLASMMNSVEIRMPFMDYRLVSYIFSLPTESKINGHFTKLILREAMKGRMSESIRTRKYKIGIGSPTEHWFRNELKPWVMDMFTSADFKNHQYVTPKDFVSHLELAYKDNNMSAEMTKLAWKEINLHLINGN